MRCISKFLAIICCLGLTSSCDSHRDLFQPQSPNLIDPDLKLDRDDYKNLTNEVYSKKGPDAGDTGSGSAPVAEPPVPDLAEILAAPKPPKLGETQLVSIAVTDDVPLKDVLIELARLADVDIEVDAGITGGISFRAKERPFNEVIARIADLAGLRYSMKNNVLRVERDTPYVQIYSLDFLNMERSSQSSESVSTSVLSSGGGSGGGGSGGSSGGATTGTSGGGGTSGSSGATGSSGGGGGGGLSNGSTSTVNSTASSDFWKQFEESIKKILSYTPGKHMSSGESSASANAAAAAGKGAPPANKQANTPVAAPAKAADKDKEKDDNSFYIISRQASTLTVSATQGQHELIKEFLKRIEANSSAQVLIEAKIVEVTLDEQFQSGIDWSKFGGKNNNFTGNFVAPGVTSAISQGGTFTFGGIKGAFDLAAAVQLAEQFGTTRTLSSPRLHAINNQEAILTIAQNFVYFSLNVTQTQNLGTTTTLGGSTPLNTITVNSTAHTVPIGIIMSLQPSINLETNEITLSVRPTLSRIITSVNDPAVAYTLAQATATTPGINLNGISSSVPIIDVKELDSIMKLKSGQVMVIGGLMQDVSTNTDAGLPGINRLPVVGELFKGTNKENTLQELVIFIRATIVDSNGNADQADKKVYKKYTRDPRPLEF